MVTQAARRHTWIAALALVLAALSVGYALVLALGANGLGLVTSSPDEGLGRLGPDAFAVASMPVRVLGAAGPATAAAANAQIPALGSYEQGAPAGAAEFFGDTAFVSIWAWELPAQLAWLAVRIIPALGLAVVWWLLFRISRDARSEHAWSARTTGRLRTMAALIGVGGPLAAVARWIVDRWLLESSTAAAVADPAALRIPLWTVAVGLALVMAAALVERATAMAEDLEGVI
ncbi:MAG: hypothetical protein ABR500_02500 [Dermatophilaceae bacterium]|nr:hypothetical protein [Intrasporangiaceae bacterium]